MTTSAAPDPTHTLDLAGWELMRTPVIVFFPEADGHGAPHLHTMRILLVEDSRILQKTVATGLRRAGYVVDVAGDGEEGLWAAAQNTYDAVVLDIMLPKLDGLSLLTALRAGGRDTHVLLLTARDAVDDRVRGLRAGADDYLVKPFAMDELVARVGALCRRGYGRKQNVVTIGGLTVDFSAKRVERDGDPVKLSAREYRLLEYLVRRRNEVVSRADIEEHIYDGAKDLMSNAVDSAVSVLRKRLSRNGALPELIHTRRGQGYVVSDSAETHP